MFSSNLLRTAAVTWEWNGYQNKSVEIDPGVCLVEKWIWYAFIVCMESVCCMCVCGGGWVGGVRRGVFTQGLM